MTAPEDEPITWSSHPVDVLKHFAQKSGRTMSPEWEAQMRAYYDQQVQVLELHFVQSEGEGTPIGFLSSLD